jgi:hypothetical protein
MLTRVGPFAVEMEDLVIIIIIIIIINKLIK